MSEIYSEEDWDSAARPEDVLRLLKYTLRHLVENTEPGLTEAFDATYDDATLDVVADLLNGDAAQAPGLSGDQHIGLFDQGPGDIVSFLINIAAAIAVARFHARHPKVWCLLVGCEAAAGGEADDRLGSLLARSGLSVEDQAKLAE
jgi:hypothetical protein